MATLTQSQISQINWYLGNIRKEFNEAVEAGEREFIQCFVLFNGAITLKVCALNDWREGIYTLDKAYYGAFGDTIEIFDYDEKEVVNMWGEDGYDYAIEEIQELAECA